MTPIMSLYKRVRKKAGIEPVDMAARLKRSIQSYWEAEKSGKRMTAKDLVQLLEIHKEYGGTLDTFWQLIEVSARRDR